jgi:hypothetical protein
MPAIQPRSISSALSPVREEIAVCSSFKRSVPMYPGKTLLIVMPGGSSLATAFAHPTMPARTVLLSPRPVIGSRAAVERIWTKRPYPSVRMNGRSSRKRKCAVS